MKLLARLVLAVLVLVVLSTSVRGAPVKPGDVISPDNASLVSSLVSPGNFVLVNQGIRMKIVPTEHIEWPPPYKVATEKDSGQVVLNDKGEVEHYVAGPAVSFY